MNIQDQLTYVDVVLKRKTPDITYQQMAEEGLRLLGTGNPDASIIEEAFALNNTPWYGDYMTIRATIETAKALEQIQQTEIAEFVRAEYPFDEEGNPIEYPTIYYTIEGIDEFGVPFSYQQPIGIILS